MREPPIVARRCHAVVGTQFLVTPGEIVLGNSIEVAKRRRQAVAAMLFRHPAQPDPGHAVRQVVVGHEYEALLARHTDAPRPAPQIDEDDVAELFYTSGSTGRPKVCWSTSRRVRGVILVAASARSMLYVSGSQST